MGSKDQDKPHLIKWLDAERALALQGFPVPIEKMLFPPPRPIPRRS